MKEMFITVGTSLYFSATWDAKPPASDMPGYKDWLTGDRRKRPEERRKWQQGKTEEKIRQRLTAEPEDIEAWTAILAQELKDGEQISNDNLRFSAELSSLLMLADSEQKFVRDLLAEYEAIHVVVDPTNQKSGSSSVAGAHLLSYLKAIAGSGAAPTIELFKVPYLASHEPKLLLGSDGGLRKLVQEMYSRLESTHADQIDLLASGGYKIYSVFLSQLVPLYQNVRLLYLYEEAKELVEVTRGHVRVGGRQFQSPFTPALG